MKNKKLSVIIARFQSPYLNSGQKELIKKAFENGDEVLILLGLSPTTITSDSDPIDFVVRKNMLLKTLKKVYSKPIHILPLKGFSNDDIWSTNVDAIIKNFGRYDVIIWGGRDSFIPYYTGVFETASISTVTDAESSTEIRKMLGESIPDSNAEGDMYHFMHGVIWAHENSYPASIPVVDIIVFEDTKEEKILLGRKSGEIKWRVFGGYTDTEDKSFVHSAIRELAEEAGLYPGIDNMHYVTSTRINDWRYKKSKNSMISTVFKCYMHHGIPIAGDDIKEVKLFKFNNELENIMIEDHYKFLTDNLNLN